MPSSPSAQPERREYRSPLRRSQAERTRAGILDAATRLFSENGWAATGSARHRPRGGRLGRDRLCLGGHQGRALSRALDVAIVGDDAPVALPERPEFQAMAAGDLRDRIEASTALNATVHARTSGLLRALREGAGNDAALAERLRAAHAGYRATVRAGLGVVAGRDLDDTEADGLWALLGWEVFDLLTREAGWSTEHYREWLAGTVERLLEGTPGGGRRDVKADRSGPADTRTMGIVHSALRRDLERTRIVLTTAPYPEGRRRRAIADHLLAMMRFLHVHHHGEDEGLWPVLQRRDPSTVALVERMEADHARIAPAIGALEATATRYGASAADREDLLAALADLGAVLLPHLEREETEAMPVVTATLTQREWDTFEQDHAIKVESFVELGDEGQWVLDGLDDAGRTLMLGLVPAPVRLVLLHGFAGRYRRKRKLLWGDGPADRVPSLSLEVLRAQP